MESERFDDFEAELKSKILSLIFVCFIHFAWVVWCMFFCFHFSSLCFEKASIWLVCVLFSYRFVASVSVLFCFVQMIFFPFHKNLQFCSRTLINCSVTSLCLLHIFIVFNYKSVAVCECKINVHDYRTGKNSWLRTVHVNLILFLFICAIKPLSQVNSPFAFFFYKNTFLCSALRANCYCSPFQKNRG